jgi:hypothetical protein
MASSKPVSEVALNSVTRATLISICASLQPSLSGFVASLICGPTAPKPNIRDVTPRRIPSPDCLPSFFGAAAAGQRLDPLDLFARLPINGGVAEIGVPVQARMRVILVFARFARWVRIVQLDFPCCSWSSTSLSRAAGEQ